jgi:hypothetical protein
MLHIASCLLTSPDPVDRKQQKRQNQYQQGCGDKPAGVGQIKEYRNLDNFASFSRTATGSVPLALIYRSMGVDQPVGTSAFIDKVLDSLPDPDLQTK